MSGYYILQDREPVPVGSVEEWAERFESDNRRVDATEAVPGVTVSTVFLGLDHSFGDGPPLLFETIVFGGPNDGDMERYSTWDQAEAGHARMVAQERSRSSDG